MNRRIFTAIFQLFGVVQIFVFAGVGHAQSMKVACVGDSITALPSGWCGYLGTDLGSGYMTQTFGVSGTTLLKNVGQPAYSSSAQYKPSHDFGPNIVVIMLGTNDSMPRNWSAGKDHFIKDYEELIDSYTSLATKPQVFINTAPPASDNNMFTISGTTIEKEVNPLIKQVAINKMVPLVDVWAALGGDVMKLASSDGVHPGAAGSKIIADAVAKAIMSPMVPTASAGAGGSAGAAGSGASAGGGAGSAGKAGAAATAAGASAVAGANASTGVAGAVAAGVAGASTGVAGAVAAGGAVASTGVSGSSGASKPPATAGAVATARAGSNSTATGAVTGAGTGATAVQPATNSDSGGCRAVGDSRSSGPTAALMLLLGLALRSRKRRPRA